MFFRTGVHNFRPYIYEYGSSCGASRGPSPTGGIGGYFGSRYVVYLATRAQESGAERDDMSGHAPARAPPRINPASICVHNNRANRKIAEGVMMPDGHKQTHGRMGYR